MKLILAGEQVMDLPVHEDVMYVGFLEDEMKQSAIAGSAGRFIFGFKRIINSVAKCCASAALPPFPQRRIFFLLFNAKIILSIAFEISPVQVSPILVFNSELSFNEFRIKFCL